jgi:lysophospholipase L1-like esterase
VGVTERASRPLLDANEDCWSYGSVANAALRAREDCAWSRVALFGTSTTAQQYGYSHVLGERLAADWNCLTETFGFGGMGISVAGHAALPRVLASRPDAVLLDFTTGTLSTPFLNHVERITLALLRSGALPVWIAYPIFAEDRSFDTRRSTLIRALERYCHSLSIPFIDAFHEFRDFIPDLFRDRVHPTQKGAVAIGETIFRSLEALRNSLPSIPAYVPGSLPRGALCRREIDICAPLKYLPLSETDLAREFERDAEGYFIVPQSSAIAFVIAGGIHSLDMRVGPYSPIVTLSDEFGGKTDHSIWDQWCHFERQILYPLPGTASFSPDIAVAFQIDFSAAKPDYSRCNRRIDFDGVEKLLKLRGVYYQGAHLDLRAVP